MITIKIEKIGIHKIIKGFGVLAIDPEETRKKHLQSILNLPESILLTNKQKEIYRHIVVGAKAKRDAAVALKQRDLKLYEKYNKKYKDSEGAENICNSELIELKKLTNEKAKNVLRDSPVYFASRKNEIVKTFAEVTLLKSKYISKDKFQQVLLDGTYIDDFRDTSFFQKNGTAWTEASKITELGVAMPVDVTNYDDLTIEQKEEIRLQNLSNEAASIEYKSKKLSLLRSMNDEKISLEMSGESTESALDTTRSLYETELNKLKLTYGIV